MRLSDLKEDVCGYFYNLPLGRLIMAVSPFLILIEPIMILFTKIIIVKNLHYFYAAAHLIFLWGLFICFIKTSRIVLSSGLALKALFDIVAIFILGFDINYLVYIIFYLLLFVLSLFNFSSGAVVKKPVKTVNGRMCPACGSISTADAVYCGECGERFGGDGTNMLTTEASKKCAKCGAPSAKHAQFCTACGSPYSPDAARREPEKPKSVCPECNAELGENDVFCFKCGAKIK